MKQHRKIAKVVKILQVRKGSELRGATSFVK